MDQMIDWPQWEARFAAFLHHHAVADAAHDPTHIDRVVTMAKRLAVAEGADQAIVVPAAWLHDCVIVPKDSPQRSQASRLAAVAAGNFLRSIEYPIEHLPAIEHAIAAHSFSANIAPLTIEARVVQDADRLDAIGAIGVARCLMLGGAMNRALYDRSDPFARQRQPDDRRYTIDHFYVKLLGLPETMQTAAGRAEAQERLAFMEQFLRQLGREIGRDWDDT